MFWGRICCRNYLQHFFIQNDDEKNAAKHDGHCAQLKSDAHTASMIDDRGSVWAEHHPQMIKIGSLCK